MIFLTDLGMDRIPSCMHPLIFDGGGRTPNTIPWWQSNQYPTQESRGSLPYLPCAGLCVSSPLSSVSPHHSKSLLHPLFALLPGEGASPARTAQFSRAGTPAAHPGAPGMLSAQLGAPCSDTILFMAHPSCLLPAIIA